MKGFSLLMAFGLSGFLTETYGQRCPDYEPGCACCEAWQVYDISGDALVAVVEQYARDFATAEVLRALERHDRLSGP